MRSQLFQKTPKAARHPTTMLIKAVLSSLLTEDSPAMKTKMDVAAIRRFSGTKNTPAQRRSDSAITLHSSEISLQGKRHALTEAAKREVARSKPGAQ
jgi:hypothetical protein